MKKEYTLEEVTDISVCVYKRRLIQDKSSPERMIADDGDQGQKLRGRAAAYNALTRVYLDVLGLSLPPTRKKKDENAD